MDLLLGEHGETLLYGIIGILMVITICRICADKWKDITPEYKNTASENSSGFLAAHEGKYPTIEADEVLFADYKDEAFSCRDYIVAKDSSGRDITEQMKVYGRVNVFQKGLYRLRCVVVSDNQLVCTKYINVIVE